MANLSGTAPSRWGARHRGPWRRHEGQLRAAYGSSSLDNYLPNARADNAIGYTGKFGGFTVGATRVRATTSGYSGFGA